MERSENRASEATRIQAEVERWLISKGASGVGQSGSYRPEDGSLGTFTINDTRDGDRSWWMLQLSEETSEGRRFAVAVSVTSGSDKVSVYISLEAGWTTSQIMPASLDPRCPKIVRNLLALPGRWYHGASTIRQLHPVRGFNDGEILAAEIEHPDRALPFIVVSSQIGTEMALPALDHTLAYDLAGLANVVTVDEDAAWALTDSLGALFSCYRGLSASIGRISLRSRIASRILCGRRNACVRRATIRPRRATASEDSSARSYFVLRHSV